MNTRHYDGTAGHRYHVARTAAGLVVVVAHDIESPGALFARFRPAPAGELAEMAARACAAGERIEPISSDHVNNRTRETWRIRHL